MNANHPFIIEKIITIVLFLIISWGMLYLWLILIHSLEEKVSATVLSSPIIYVCILLSTLSFGLQKQGGALKDLYTITLWLLGIFIGLVLFFCFRLNTLPNQDDLIFYMEAFLITFFTCSPFFLFIRMM